MRIVPTSATIAAFVITLSTAMIYAEDGVAMTSNEALNTITNVSSSANEFNTAIKVLDPIVGEASFWLRLAEDERYNPDRRRRFAKHYFQHFVVAGMTLGEVETSLGTNLSCVSYKHIRKIQRDWSLGWIPSALLKGKSGFSIPILSDASGDYHLVVFMSLEEDPSLEDFVNELTGKVKEKIMAKVKIAACEVWDSDRQVKRDPGSKFQAWPWD